MSTTKTGGGLPRVATLALGTAIAAGIALPASAATASIHPRPQTCPGNNMYETSSPSSKFVGDGAKTVYGASGVTLSLSVSSGTTWSGSLSGTISGDESGIILSAQQSISASISYSKTTTVTLGGSWTVPSSQSSGWLALGSMGYRFNWSYVHENGNCTTSTIRSGTAIAPAQSPFIDHS